MAWSISVLRIDLIYHQMIGKQHVYVSEVSEVNPGEQSLVMRSKNVSFNHILTVEEHIEYRADPTNPERLVPTQASCDDEILWVWYHFPHTAHLAEQR